MAHAYAAPPTKAEIEEVVEEYFAENPVEGVSEYREIKGKPQINGVELDGNKTAKDLKLQPAGNYLTEVPEGYVKDEDLDDYAKRAELPEVPAVPAWAMQPAKPTYTANEVCADPAGSAEQALTDANSFAGQEISNHNVSTDAHNDLRVFLNELNDKVNHFLDIDDTTKDQASEIVKLIEDNRGLIEQITTDKVNVSDIIDNLTTNLSNKALAASMGVYLKQLIDAKVIPSKVSAFENDAGYLTDCYELKWKHKWNGATPKAAWYLTLYKNGVVCEDELYAEVLYATSLSAICDKESSYTGLFVGTLDFTTNNSYKIQVNVYTNENKEKQLCSETLIPSTFDKSLLLNFLYPVGSVYITNTNEAPAIGGEWELVGKGFREEQGNGTTALFTPNADNTDTCTVYYRRSGNTLWLKFVLKTLVTVVDTTRQFGTLKLAALGVTAFAHQTMHQMPFGSENGIGLFNVTTAGALSSIDARPKANDATSIASGSTFYGQYTLPYMADQMLDDFCDKFYWKRTA